MRAREPDRTGYVESDGIRIGYEVHGSAEPTLLLMPTWTIVHARFWKAQVPYLARHFRVVTFDGPGNGSSDRPLEPDHYRAEAVSAAAEAVMDATGTRQAILVSLSQGANWALHFAADRPQRAIGAVFTGPALPLAPPREERREIAQKFDKQYTSTEGWAKYNRRYWLDHYEDFLWFFFGQVFSEAHSTKQTEDAVGWGLETTPEVLVAESHAPSPGGQTVREWCARVECPVLVIHGDNDRIVPYAVGQELAAATGGELVLLRGSGHVPQARDPVKVNLLIREFVETRVRAAATSRPRADRAIRRIRARETA